jgi:transcriptional regulator with XRE-family HTH domain
MTHEPKATIKMPVTGALIREARLRAGLTQTELGARTGKDRAQIARWERDDVAPSIDTVLELIRACGYDLSLDLVEYLEPEYGGLVETARLTPQERVARMLRRLESGRAR